MEEILPDQEIIFYGDVKITGSIGDRANILVIKGTIQVFGKTGNHVRIQVKNLESRRYCEGIMGLLFSAPPIRTEPGNISLGVVGNECHIKTDIGNIRCHSIGEHSKLSTKQGNIWCYLGSEEHVQIQCDDGNVFFGKEPPVSVQISHPNGELRIGARRRPAVFESY